MQRAFDIALERLLDGRRGPLLLAVSGGCDSMTMLHLVRHCPLQLPFAVAHVNFILRPGDCDADEALVRATCSAAGIPFYTKKFNTAAYADEKGVSIEMAARELRYGWFSELMAAHGYGYLLVAHNQNDGAETMLLNMLRGTGLNGICGIREANGNILRPMLGFSRASIEAFAAANGIAFREDITNGDTAIARNRIRHNVFAEFEKINPSYLDTLTADMARWRQAAGVLDGLFAERRDALCSTEGDATLISISALAAEPHKEYWMYRILEPFGFTSSQVADALEAIGAQSGKEFTSAKYRLLRDRNFFKIYPLEAAATPTLEVRVFDAPEGFDPRRHPEGVLYADADTLQPPLQVRPWRQGDRFTPLGMHGSRLVSDFFTDLKLDLEQKQRAGIVFWNDASGEHIAAVAPYRIDDRHKITTATRRVAEIKLAL